MVVYIIAAIILLLPILFLFPTKVINKKNRPKKKQGGILSCNHYTLVDPLVIGAHILNRRLYFFSKKEFAQKNPIGRFLIWSLGSVAIDRENPEIGSLKKAISLMKKGKLLLVFPEGTRNKTGAEDMLKMKNGSVQMSIRSGTPIFPAVLYRKPKVFRKNYLIYGEPVSFEEFKGKPLTKETLEEGTLKLQASMDALRAELHEYLESRKSPRKKAREARKAAKAQAEK